MKVQSSELLLAPISFKYSQKMHDCSFFFFTILLSVVCEWKPKAIIGRHFTKNNQEAVTVTQQAKN